jgi:hypothetical protein
MKKIIILICIILLAIPIFFERIYDDEAIYWSRSKSVINRGLSEIPSMTRMPLAMLVVAPFLGLNDSIFVARFISVLFAIATAVIIFEIVKTYSNEQAAFISALLFIFSFQTIRFATRFYLDIYGVFFFLLSLFLIEKNRVRMAGLFFALAMLSREIWFGLYPFIVIYLWKSKKSVNSFLILSVIPVLIFVLFIHLTVGMSTYLSYSGAAQTMGYISNNLSEILVYLTQSWAEFLILQIITVVGSISWIWNKRDNLLILILPQFLVISLIQGFICNGALTQYAMGLQASMALLAGPGIVRIWKRYFQKYPLNTSLFLILILQFLLFSYLATILSLRGAIGVHDFGYWDDEAVIQLLNQKAGNDSIAGLHGAFIKNAKEWIWWERNVTKVLEIEPDWYVIVEPQLIKFKTATNTTFVEIYQIGPYVVLHSHPRGHLHEVIEPNEEFSKWVFRR